MKVIEKQKMKPEQDKLLVKKTEVRDPNKLVLKQSVQAIKLQRTDYEQRYMWNVSLPGCGYEPVSVLEKDGCLYAGTNGYVYKLDLNGNILATNGLPHRGHCDINLAITNEHLVVGTNGYVVLVNLNNFGNTSCNINVSLPGCGHEKVSVLYDINSNFIYVGSNGYVYRLNNIGIVLSSNWMPDRGHEEVRLALTSNHLVAGTNGYVVLIGLNDFSQINSNKNISLPGCGHEIVSVLFHNNYVYAGSNGYVYKMNPNGGDVQTNNLPDRGNEEVRLAISENHLIAGTKGYVVLVDLNNFSSTSANVNVSLPNCGHEIVSVALDENKIYAGSNGYAYEIAAQTGHVLVCYGLPGLSFHEIRFDIHNHQMYIGTNGYLAAPEIIENLDVDLIAQETNQWCWAASGQMVMRYLGKDISQCEQANYRFDRNDCCITFARPVECIRPGNPNLHHWGFHYEKTKYGTALSFEQLQQQINSEKPILFSWKWTGGGGHLMVSKGYSKLSQMVLVNDPWPPNKGNIKWISYGDYVSGGKHLHGVDTYNISQDELKERPQTMNNKIVITTATYDSSQEAALNGLNRFMVLVNEHNYHEMGFNQLIKNREELELADKLDIFFVRHDHLRDFGRGDKATKLLLNMNEHIYLVKHQSKVVTAVTTQLINDCWQVKSLGDSHLSKDIATALKQCENESTYMLVTIPSLHKVFLGIKEGENLSLIQLLNDNLNNYQKQDAREVFYSLQSDPTFDQILKDEDLE